MQSQLEINAQHLTYLDKLNAALPDAMVNESAKMDSLYAESTLSTKVKRLDR